MWPTLFDLFSLLYAVLGIRTLVQLIRQWRAFWDDTLTPEEQRLAQSVGFFFIIPLGVLLHEYGHLVATRMVGGRVVEFQWRLFWGYVVPVGDFSPAQDWWIALSGNLVSVLFGLVLLATGYWGRRFHHTLRYLLLQTGYFQVMYALVGYPVLSLLGFVGDWIVIYDFRATPVLSAATAVVHLIILVGVWKWWKSRPVQLCLYRLTKGGREDEELAALERAVEERPDDVLAYVQLADAYAERSAWNLVEQTVREALRKGLEHPHLYMLLGYRWLGKGRLNKGREAFQRALDLGASRDEADSAWLNLGIVLVNEGKYREALYALNQVRGSVRETRMYLYLCGLAKRNLGDREGAIADLEAALQQPYNPHDYPPPEMIKILLDELRIPS